MGRRSGGHTAGRITVCVESWAGAGWRQAHERLTFANQGKANRIWNGTEETKTAVASRTQDGSTVANR